MNDNVISFPQRLGNRENSKDRNDPRDHENRIRARDLMRLREIQHALRTKRDQPRFSEKDRRRAATALWEMKENYTARGQQNAIKEAFGDTHIHRLMMKPKAEVMDSHALAKNESRTVIRPYLTLATAIAKVAGKNADDFQILVLRNTSYWKNYGRSPDRSGSMTVVDEAANAVAFLIERLSARIIRDTDLNALFARMRRVCGQWDIRTESFRVSPNSCLFATAYENWYEHWTEAPPFPSVPLVRLWHAGLGFRAHVSTEGSIEPFNSLAPQEAIAPEKCDEKPVELHIFREIRLALGPTVNADTPGPMFESRAYVELRVLDNAGEVLSRGPLDINSNWNFRELNPECSAAVLFNDRWHRFTPLAALDPNQSVEEITAELCSRLSGLSMESPFFWDFTPLAEDKSCYENWYISYTPVDSAHITHWLDRQGDGWGQPVDFMPDAAEPNPVTETWLPRASLGRLVELAIAEGRLEAALRSRIADVRKAFEIHETEWRERMQERTAKLIAEFDSDQRFAHPTDDESSTS
jgi:hypothetical protein